MEQILKRGVLILMALMMSFHSVMAKGAAGDSAEYPAQIFRGHTEEVDVKAEAQAGVFPEFTEMRVEPVDQQRLQEVILNGGGRDAVAVDITFYDHNGNEIQPAEGGRVRVTLSARRTVNGSTHQTVTMDDQGRMEIVADAGSDYSCFDAAHFTIYAIVGSDADVRTETYNFYVDGELYQTVIIKSAGGDPEVLTEPSAPQKEGYAFTGWFSDENLQEQFSAFGLEREIVDGRQTDLYAGFRKQDDCIYINYHNADQQLFPSVMDCILRTVIIERPAGGGETEYTPTSFDAAVSDYPNNDAGIPMEVTGWNYNGSTYNGTPITFTADSEEIIDLYPAMEAGVWLYFDAAGGVYVEPEFVGAAGVTEERGTSRDGYTFLGWYNGEERFEFGSQLSETTTLTARWEGQEVSYCIEVWHEAPTYSDDSYYLEKTITNQAEVGAMIDMDYLRSISESYVSDTWGDSGIFSLNEEMTEPYSGITVNGDGSTVARIYMKRSRHTLIVKDFDGSEIARFEDVKYDVDDWTYAGFTFWQQVWDLDRVAEINAVKDENGLSKYYWSASWWPSFWLDPSAYNMHFRKMSNGLGFPQTVSIEPKERGKRYEYTIRNYFEWLDDETTPAGAEIVEHTDNNDVTARYYLDSVYTVWLTASANGTVAIGPDGFHLVQGIGNIENAEDRVGSHNIYHMSPDVPVNVYFTRNVNTVMYIPGKGYDPTVYTEVPFNGLISNYPAEGDLTAGETLKTVQNVTYRFMGWSQTENGDPISDEEYAVMRVFPDKDYNFYGIWIPETYHITFEPENGQPAETVDVLSGTAVSRPADPVKDENSYFVGWYANGNVPYNFATLLTREDVDRLGDLASKTITLYAGYSDFPGHPVVYDLNGGSGTAPVNTICYCSGGAFPVTGSDGVVAPEQMTFAGWETADGKLYQEASALTVTEEMLVDGVILLKAHYCQDPALTKLIYDISGSGTKYTPEFPEGTETLITVSGLTNNQTVELADYAELTGMDEPDGYFFAGWYSDAACTDGNELTKAVIDRDDDDNNIVYAKWLPKTVVITYVLNGGNYNGSTGNIVIEYPYGEEITLYDAPSRNGYDFL